MSAGSPTRVAADADTTAALEEQRDFLLRSLDDLRREHDAGDVDDTDFQALEDDYTARAARVIRALEARRSADAAAAEAGTTGPTVDGGRASRSGAPAWRRRSLVVAGVLAFAVLAGVLVAQAAGRRGSDDTITGDIRETTRTQLDEAIQLAGQQDYDGAIAIYDEVLAEQPDNVEALTFKGWSQFLSGDEAGVVTLIDAVETDPEYPAAHAFLAVVFQRLGRPETALLELDRLDALDPPQEILGLVEGLRAELEAEVAGDGATGTTGGPTATTDGPTATTAPAG